MHDACTCRFAIYFLPAWIMFLLWAIPDVLELVQLMEGFETDEVGNMSYDYSGWALRFWTQADLAATWNLAATHAENAGDDMTELCGLWNVAPAQGLTLLLVIPPSPRSLSLSLSLSSLSRLCLVSACPQVRRRNDWRKSTMRWQRRGRIPGLYTYLRSAVSWQEEGPCGP